MIEYQSACKKLIKPLDDNAKMREISHKRRSKTASLNKLQQMTAHLEATFRLWPANAEKLMKNDKDKLFMHSMETDRCATFGSRDKVLATKCQRRTVREQLFVKRREKCSLRLQLSVKNVPISLLIQIQAWMMNVQIAQKLIEVTTELPAQEQPFLYQMIKMYMRRSHMETTPPRKRHRTLILQFRILNSSPYSKTHSKPDSHSMHCMVV